ncbi:MAG: ABC transporter permease [Rhodospirillaceae bacterium]|nr:ABC transporter permease [Rhodospirillaceae bacterium]
MSAAAPTPPSAPTTEARGFDRRRLAGFVRKEWLQVLRDPSSIIVAVALPLFMLFLFGYGVSLDAKHLPLAVVTESSAPEARDFMASLRATHYVTPQIAATRAAVVDLLREGRVSGVAVIGDDFGPRLATGAVIQVIVNGTDANTARIMIGYVQGAAQSWLAHRNRALGHAAAPMISVQSRVWFNETLDSHKSIVPGLIAVIMTLIGALLTALVIAREWERGTMEALLTTPLTKAELIIGKLVPYFVLGMGGMVVSVVVALAVFHIGFRGSFLVLAISASAFMLTVLGFGLMVSTITRNQFAAAIVAITATLMPAILLSGFIFDLRSMPAVVQAITVIVPARYFVEILKTLFLAGNVWSIIIPNTAALIAMAALFLAVTARKTRRRLA